MKDIERALITIEEDYKECFKMISKFFDYLETFGLKEFNGFSKYKWSNDLDKNKGGSYICIRSGNSLNRKCDIKKRSHMEDSELFKWADHKELLKDAMDEAYQYIEKKVNIIKNKIEELKEIAQLYEKKLDDVTLEYDAIRSANRKLVEKILTES
ncbi:MAG: hypothetical protein LBH07_03120 [Treponema sp.]|jgi:hypothetical protein|nr:hypothetical protein [Treponema sp.]